MADYDPVKIPKNNGRAFLSLLGALLVLAALVLIGVGFVDAGEVAPDETQGSTPPVRTPGTLPQ